MSEFSKKNNDRINKFDTDIENASFNIFDEEIVLENHRARRSFTRITQYGESTIGEVRFPIPSTTEAIVDVGYRDYSGWVRIRKDLGSTGLALETFAHHGDFPNIESETPFTPARGGLENWKEVHDRGKAVARLCYVIDQTLHDEIELPGYYGRPLPLKQPIPEISVISHQTYYKNYEILVGPTENWASKYDERVPNRYNIVIVHPSGEKLITFHDTSRQNFQSFSTFIQPAITYIDKYLAV